MCAFKWTVVVAGLLVASVANWELVGKLRAEPPAKPDDPAAAAPADELSIGTVQKFKNLTIFPVVSRGKCDADNYITLDEGLLSGKVKVFEIGASATTAATQPAPAAPSPNSPPVADPFAAPAQTNTVQEPAAPQPAAPQPAASQPPAVPATVVASGNGTLTLNLSAGTQVLQLQGGTLTLSGQVNRLVVTNESGKPLYLMPGETITGGKQDRTLAQALVIASDGKPVEVNVFCVEHGRWSLRSETQTAQLATSLYGSKVGAGTILELGKKAANGQLVLGGSTVTKGTRLTVNSGTTQSDVWDKVSKTNASTGNLSLSSAYTENFTSKEVTDKFQPYLEALEKSVAGTERIVGVVVAVDGKIEPADVFESTPLFRKLWPKLLKSYGVLDALASAKPEEKACADTEAMAFLKQAQTAKVEKSQQQPGVIVVMRSSDRMASFCTSPAAAKDAAKPVHTATFAK